MLEPRQFAEWIQEEVFQPVIVVIATPIAKYRVKESLGLSLAEFFAPFGGDFQRIPVTCTCLEKQVRLDNIRFRFEDSDETTQWSSQHADRMANWAVEVKSPRTPLSEDLGMAATGPWYENWRSAILRSLRWSEHEGLDQPAAALLVASSKESDLVSLFEQLLHASNMPPLCTQGVLDPVPGRCAVLLHDTSDPESPSAQALEAKLDEVKSRFPPHLCMVLRVSCGVPADGSSTDPIVEELYKPIIQGRGPPTPEGAGGATSEAASSAPLSTSLSREDLERLAQIGRDVIIKGAVPWMEAQLSILDGQITHTRKGFRNQLKYLWRKPRETTTGTGTTVPAATTTTSSQSEKGQDASLLYSLQTTEGQMRLAGDLSFHLKDYETALSYYRSVLGDFKQDKSYKHMAGACEMAGVCAYILGQGPGEFDKLMENAYEYYSKAGATRHAMRAVCLHRAMVTDYKEAVTRLMKVSGDLSGESGLRNAMILEQAAHLYGLSGWKRKAAFHMVLAGHNFSKLGLKKLALRSYHFVCTNYVQKRWMHIIDHVHFTMARQAFGLGLLPDSLAHFVALVNSFNQNHKRKLIQADREATYLKEFLFVVKTRTERGEASAEEPSTDLLLPAIAPEIMVVLPADVAGEHAADGGRSISSSSAPPPPPPPPPLDGAESEDPFASATPWETMGDWLVSALTQDEKLELRWRDRRDERVFDTLQRVAPVGADVFVDLKLTNPLRAKLDLTGARLYGTLTERLGEESEPVTDNAGDALVFREQAISIAPSETKTVRFSARATRVGVLRIEGVSWKFFDQVPCRRALKAPRRRLRATLEQRASKEGVYSADTRLQVKVRAKLPQATATLEGWPSAGMSVLQGEHRQCTLVLRGKGVQSASIATSHPAFIGFSDGVGTMAPSDGRRFPHGGVLRTVAMTTTEDSNCVAKIPFTLRADGTGKHAIRLCILIEAAPQEGVKPAECRQWITVQERLTVLPSFACSVSHTPSVTSADRYLLSCSFENKSSVALEVKNVRCLSGDKELNLKECGNGSGAAARRADPAQMMQLVFLYDRGEITTAHGESSSVNGNSSAVKQWQLLQASRSTASTSNSSSMQLGSTQSAESVDVIVQWQSAVASDTACSGEVYLLRIPCERSSSTPCPLAAQIHAPEHAVLAPDVEVPVTVVVQNPPAAGDVSFYIVADTPPDFLWLGRERSEVIHLSGGCSHKLVVHAYFYAPGVYALNRFRLFVVALTSGTVPVTEQAPLAFGFPHEKYIHIREEKVSAEACVTK